MITMLQVQGGWLALAGSPRIAGYGRTPPEAQADLELLLQAFWAALESVAEEGGQG